MSLGRFRPESFRSYPVEDCTGPTQAIFLPFYRYISPSLPLDTSIRSILEPRSGCFIMQQRVLGLGQASKFALSPVKNVRGRSVQTHAAADRPLWRPGSTPPKHLDGSLPADFGFDPLGLGGDPEFLKWAAESERVHSRWAMLAVAGILAQEIYRPDIFW